VVTAPLAKVEVIVTEVAAGLSDAFAAGFAGFALEVCADDLEASAGVVVAVFDEVEGAAAVSVTGALDEVVLGVEVEASLDVVVVPASADVVVVACPLSPEREAGGGGDSPAVRTTYVHSLS